MTSLPEFLSSKCSQRSGLLGAWAMVGIAAAALAIALCLAGCASTPSAQAGGTQESYAGTAPRAVVAVGLSRVDPAGYDGWTGACPGTERDARWIYETCAARGFHGRLLLDAAATWPTARRTCLETAALLPAKGLLVLAFSGHGGWVDDDNGDEPSGRDSTLCFYDRQVRDDEILAMLREMRPDLRILILSDSCHSEGNFKSAVMAVQRAVSGGKWGKRPEAFVLGSNLELRNSGREGSRNTGKLNRTAFDSQLIQIAACPEAALAAGSGAGGTLSLALRASLGQAGTYMRWFADARARMPASQQPVWVEFGPVTDAFRYGRVLE